MASTAGGFLVGIGLMILLLSSAAFYSIQSYYTLMYREIMKYKPMIEDANSILHSPAVDEFLNAYTSIYGFRGALNETIERYHELAAFEPEVRDMAEAYEKAYPKLIELKAYVDQLYESTNSTWYGSALNSLSELSKYEEWPMIGGIIRMLNPRLMADFMKNMQEFSRTAEDTLRLIQAIPPKKFKGYLVQIESFIRDVPPNRLETYMKQLNVLLKELTPEKLRSYIYQARSTSEKALALIETVENYPPTKIFTYTYIGMASGLALLIAGIALIIKARSKATPIPKHRKAEDESAEDD